MEKDLVTRTEYKAYVGITNPNQDAEIDILIPKVSKMVKTYCRTSFVDNAEVAKVEVFNGENYPQYYLKEYPVISVQSVEYSTDYGQTYTPLAKYQDWVYDPQSLSVRSLNSYTGWTASVSGYRVTYTCGYLTAPEDLKLAVMDLITYYRRNDSVSHSSKGAGSGSLQIEYLNSTTLPAHIRRILDQYVVDYT